MFIRKSGEKLMYTWPMMLVARFDKQYNLHIPQLTNKQVHTTQETHTHTTNTTTLYILYIVYKYKFIDYYYEYAKIISTTATNPCNDKWNRRLIMDFWPDVSLFLVCVINAPTQPSYAKFNILYIHAYIL